jgi:hypothetical protein
MAGFQVTLHGRIWVIAEEIILEADASLLNRVRRIVMEYHNHLSNNYSHVDILEKLKILGFQASSYNPNGTYGMIAAYRP